MFVWILKRTYEKDSLQKLFLKFVYPTKLSSLKYVLQILDIYRTRKSWTKKRNTEICNKSASWECLWAFMFLVALRGLLILFKSLWNSFLRWRIQQKINVFFFSLEISNSKQILFNFFLPSRLLSFQVDNISIELKEGSEKIMQNNVQVIFKGF